MLWYVLAALVMVAAWAAWLLLGLPLWAAVLLTVLAVGGLVALVVVRRLQARKAAREIERALSAQGDAYAKSARPDLQPEIQEMQAEFAKAVSALKGSKLARGGRDALSVLPFYMIIGPPGAGKSTALRNSGLQFPYLSSRGGGVKGVGGTRNCEWWLTNQAVLLDTAGRYTTEDDDRDEWLSFLDTLARTRSRRPINGLLVAVSVGELLDVGPEAAAELGQKLRERVDEVMSRLKLILPVYLVLTKCDLLAGFVESFGDLNKQDRGQIWGFTLPLGKREVDPAEVFQERFDELVGALERHTLERVARERRLEARQQIYQFPQQVEGLRANLAELVGTLFAENVYQDTPLMRGVYFTSGTQEGRPIDRIMGRMAEAFGVQRALGGLTGGLEAAVEAKSYFLRDVFGKVLFPDADVAVKSSSESRREVVRKWAALGGALAFALVVMLFPTLAYFRGRSLVDSTRDRLAQLAPGAPGSGSGAAALAALGPARERLAELHEYETEGPPAALRWGMYPGEKLYGAARTAYGAALRRSLLDPLLREDARDLEAFALSVEGQGEAPTEKEYVRYFDKLKLHLLLTGPRAAGETGLTEAEQAWVGTYVAERWRRRPGASADAAQLREVQAHAQLFAQLAADDAGLLGARNDLAVRKSRAALARVPFAQRALEKLVQSPAFEPYELTLGSIVGGGVSQLRSAHRVRGAFTRRGWEEVVQKALEGDLGAEDAWVLGLGGGEDGGAEERMRLLKAYYFQRYVQEWRSFLESVRVSTPASSAEALALLEDLTRGVPPPLGRLFAALAQNVKLSGGMVEDAAERLGGEVVDRLKKRLGAGKAGGAVQAASGVLGGGAGGEVQDAKDLARVFAPLLRFGAPTDKEGEARPLDIYQEQLVFLRDGVRTDLENPDDHGPLLARLQSARVRVASLVDGQDIGWRPLLQALLWPPVEAVSRASTEEAAAGTSQRWCSAVVSAYDRSLAHRYPFDPDGHDAAIADVADFFRPKDGVVWGFYTEALQGDMLREGDHFAFTKRMGNVASNIYSPAILTFLSRADELSGSLFAPGAGELGVQFSAHIQPSPGVASIALQVDGQSVEYRNGPEEWHSLKWPSPGKTLGAAIRVRTTKGNTETLAQEGEWGLYRLLEMGQVRASPGARVFTVVWRVESLGVDVAVDFRPARTETPFFGALKPGQKPQLMRPFRATGVLPPRAIGKGSPPCEG